MLIICTSPPPSTLTLSSFPSTLSVHSTSSQQLIQSLSNLFLTNLGTILRIDSYPTPSSTQTARRFAFIPDARPIPFSPLQAHFQNKRYKKALRDNLPAAINKPTIRRLARRGGVKRIKKEIYSTAQEVVKSRLTEIIRTAVELVDHRNQKTLTALDVVYALRVLGNPIYGCGTIYRGDNVGSRAEYMRGRRAEMERNVRETRARVGREDRERRVDEMARRMGGSVNLRGR